MLTLLVVFLSLTGFCNAAGQSWSYSGPKGPTYWSKIGYPECDGQSQTPINFPKREDMIFDENLKTFNLVNFSDKTAYSLQLTNNGHTVTAVVNGTMKVQGGGLKSTYYVAQFHWHWGKDDNDGSEHEYDSNKYAMELHVVAYNSRYQTVQEAFDKADGLAVLGFFYELSEINNCNYEPVIKYLPDILYPQTSKDIPSFNVRHLFPEKIVRFYRYKGGLTTPPCHQSVTWSVFEEHIKISKEQLSQFRTLLEADNTTRMVDNHRPIQPINDRKVYISYKVPTDISRATTFEPVLMVSLVALFFHLGRKVL